MTKTVNRTHVARGTIAIGKYLNYATLWKVTLALLVCFRCFVALLSCFVKLCIRVFNYAFFLWCVNSKIRRHVVSAYILCIFILIYIICVVCKLVTTYLLLCHPTNTTPATISAIKESARGSWVSWFLA